MGHNSKSDLLKMPASSPSAAVAFLPSDIESRSASRVDLGTPRPDDKSTADYLAKRRAFIQALARQEARELMAQTLPVSQEDD